MQDQNADVEGEKRLAQQQIKQSRKTLDVAEQSRDLAEESHRMAIKRTEWAKQRTQLANQRTFLSWIRTGLALIGFGFGIDQFILFLRENKRQLNNLRTDDFGNTSLSIGILMVILGILMVILGFLRYRKYAHSLDQNIPTYDWVSIAAVLCILAGGGVILYDLFTHL